ncbi:hypothetical protein LTR29_014869 [Friedmanniomyces endolithicus]|nr:hypothetical protein LTR29_014869 [Friedmanniomyces endolithicus]
MQVAQEPRELATNPFPGSAPIANGAAISPGPLRVVVNNGGPYSSANPGGITAEHPGLSPLDARSLRTKQKRNKPTLSCLECVERKTKFANLIASADHKTGRDSQARFVTKPLSKIRKTSTASSTTTITSPVTDNGWTTIENRAHRKSMSSNGSSPYLLSNVPYSQSSPSNVFGIGSQHPFSNYWTCQGGLPEVISVMPSKEQADILIARYFEAVDPVYPFIHRRSFYADYERFWSVSLEERGNTDASFVALHYAMYALGTQFMPFPLMKNDHKRQSSIAQQPIRR